MMISLGRRSIATTIGRREGQVREEARAWQDVTLRRMRDDLNKSRQVPNSPVDGVLCRWLLGGDWISPKLLLSGSGTSLLRTGPGAQPATSYLIIQSSDHEALKGKSENYDNAS
jgi:hypothetical protein